MSVTRLSAIANDDGTVSLAISDGGEPPKIITLPNKIAISVGAGLLEKASLAWARSGNSQSSDFAGATPIQPLSTGLYQYPNTTRIGVVMGCGAGGAVFSLSSDSLTELGRAMLAAAAPTTNTN